MLRAMGCAVTEVHGHENAPARLRAAKGEVELVILDVASPDSGTSEIYRRIRADCALPLVILADRGNLNDALTGWGRGADDFLVKPVGPRVLEARLRALLRGSTPRSDPREGPLGGPAEDPPEPPTEEVIDLGPLRVHTVKLTAVRDGAATRLTPTEVRLLLELAAHPRRTLSRRNLLERVWGHRHAHGDPRLVDACVSRLRRKIEPDPSAPTLLLTVRGAGYRLSV
jgi:DNA-binding response OmpR family regulator